MADDKTNVLRLLDREGAAYRTHGYDASDGKIDGAAVAEKLGLPPEAVYKTLVTAGAGRAHYVFVIPVLAELDLKKAARAVGEKAVEMIKPADLPKVTGYVRGGCSPIGMKRELTTVVDASCLGRETMVVSAGRIGRQVELSPQDLLRAAKAVTAELVRD